MSDDFLSIEQQHYSFRVNSNLLNSFEFEGLNLLSLSRITSLEKLTYKFSHYVM